jgi:DNA polymerase-1
MPARQVIWQIERNGILIDATFCRQSHEMGQKIMALEAQAYELAGQPFNLASPKQLGDILFNKLGLPVKKTATGGPSTDEEVLPNWRSITRCPSCCSSTAACPSSRAPTPTSCRA